MSDALAALSRHAGILPGYRDLTGAWHETTPEVARCLLSAMGLADAPPAETLEALKAAEAARPLPDWLVVEAGTAPRLAPKTGGDWRLELEDGGIAEGRAGEDLALPPLPLGLHRLTVAGHETTLLAAPASLPLPPRGWGVTLPLYGLRDSATGGLGDYDDLRAVVSGIGAQGAGFVGINPIHAGFPTDPGAISPYSPSSRRRFSVAHIACAGEGRVPSAELVEYPPAVAARLACLRAAFAALTREDAVALDAFRQAGGPDLQRFAIHQALADRHGPYWTDWPADLHSPESAAVAHFAAEHAQDIAFHAWLQSRAEAQLAAVAKAGRAAGMAQGLYLDLAVGTHPAGAETWADPGLFAQGVSLGAPPDAFAPQGQAWNLAPMIPAALAARGFRPLAETLRAQLKFAGLLRIDHILGFDRAFWVPQDGPGAYVAMPREALLAVARIEAARAGAALVGEDLGVVPDGLQAALAGAGIMGCRLAMFSPDTGHWPEAVLASFGTHDLPPFAGWTAGADIGWHARLGHIEPASAAAMQDARGRDVAALAGHAGDTGADAMHALLAQSPARLVAVQAEDVLGLADQPNLPGTVDSHPNWRRRLGKGPAEIANDPGLGRVAAIMRCVGRGGDAGPSAG